MCSDPITKDNLTFACSRCNECIATRRHGWVARAMAEKSDFEHSACITLTYSDETQEGRDGAAMFRYADVSAFLKRLRAAASYEAKKGKWNFAPIVRFLCAGEQGDRFGRCHWHIVLFTNFDLSRLGKFRLRGKLVSHRRDMITEGKRKRRLNWTLWDYGFVTLQDPDEGAMSYVLSYCLKDQFTYEKSQGTMREAKSENFATGLFRMSKRPAIGENFLMLKLESLLASGSVLPSLQISIPEFRGYWQPSGSFRKKLLWGLVAVNRRVLWSTGANAPQWASLLSSLSENQADLDILNGQETSDEETLSHQILKRSRLQAGEATFAAIRRTCGGAVACSACLDFAAAETLAEHGIEAFDTFEGFRAYRPAQGTLPFEKRDRPGRLSPHSLCQRAFDKQTRIAFFQGR